MALVKFGGGVLGMSGRIGGNVFARNRSGSYVRQGTKPVNTNTSRQQEVRGNMQTLSTRWLNVLTSLQREQWNAYASAVLALNKLGETIQLTGFNWYVGNNAVILSANGQIVDIGPATLNKPDADPTFAIAVDDANQEIAVTFDNTLPWANDDDGHMLVSMGTPVNPTRDFFAGPFRIAGTIDGDAITAPTSPATLTAPFAVQEGQRVYAQARVMEGDGRVSQFFRDDTLVVA